MYRKTCLMGKNVYDNYNLLELYVVHHKRRATTRKRAGSYVVAQLNQQHYDVRFACRGLHPAAEAERVSQRTHMLPHDRSKQLKSKSKHHMIIGTHSWTRHSDSNSVFDYYYNFKAELKNDRKAVNVTCDSLNNNFNRDRQCL